MPATAPFTVSRLVEGADAAPTPLGTGAEAGHGAGRPPQRPDHQSPKDKLEAFVTR